VYTIENKNVVGIMGFKYDFGIWFFNGVFVMPRMGKPKPCGIGNLNP
jgi:hypothetical protein